MLHRVCTVAPIRKVIIFSSGGLVGVVSFAKSMLVKLAASSNTKWSEDVSLSGMLVSSLLLKIYCETGENVIGPKKFRTLLNDPTFSEPFKKIVKPQEDSLFIVYIDDKSDFFAIAEYTDPKKEDKILNYLKDLVRSLKDFPEESNAVCFEATKIAKKYFKILGIL